MSLVYNEMGTRNIQLERKKKAEFPVTNSYVLEHGYMAYGQAQVYSHPPSLFKSTIFCLRGFFRVKDS